MFSLPRDEASDDYLPVSVVFRRWITHAGTGEGEIIALFPFIPGTVTNAADDCMCYEHTGQHGAAEYLHVIAQTRAVDDLDAADLQALRAELVARGYTLQEVTNEEACYQAGYKAGIKA